MMKSLPLAVIIAGSLAACAQTPAQTARAAQDMAASRAALEKTLAGLVPAENRMTCLPTLPSTNVKAYGPTLVYTVSPQLKYRTETTGGCEGLEHGDDILVTVSNGGRTCQGDISRTIDRASRFPTGSCALGDFVEYRKP